MEKGQEWKGISYKSEEFDHLYNVLTDIKSYLGKQVTETNFKATYESCYRFFSGFPVPILEVTDKMLLRTRPNYNGELFTCEEDISYNSKQPHLIRLGRFNRPGEPIFYACLPTISNKSSFLATSMLESRKEVVDNGSIENTFDFTTGTWEIKPFTSVCLCFDDKHLSTNQRMKDYIDYFRNYIKTRCSEKDASFIIDTLNYFSDLSSIKASNENVYMVLTAVFCALRMIYLQENTEVNGIVYPSSVTESIGLNIALTKKAVDANLKLTQAVMHRIERWSNDKYQLDMYPITGIEKVIDGKFQFTDIGDKRSKLEQNYINKNI